MGNGVERTSLIALRDAWNDKDTAEADWELSWVDRLREAVPDPEAFVIMDDAIVPKSDVPWGIPVYRFGRRDDAFGMTWWAHRPDVGGLEAFGQTWVYLLDPIAVLASWRSHEGERQWIVDKGLMRAEEISPV